MQVTHRGESLERLVVRKCSRELGPQHFTMLVRLAQYSDADGNVDMPIRALTHVCHLKSHAGTGLVMDRLVKLGYVEREVRSGNGNMNRYRLVTEKLHAMPELPISPELL